MPTLTLLGRAVLADGDRIVVTGRPGQRHSLALLAVLAEGRRGVSRDRIVALLWPASDVGTARHRLSVCLHLLRQRLGEATIVAAGDALVLGAGWDVDVWRFEACAARGAFADARVAYRGPLLEAFFLRGAPEFEPWLEAWRQRLARRFLSVVDALAEDAARTGDVAASLEYQHELIAHEPWSGARTVALMRALAAAGEVEGAIRCSRAYAMTVREDYGLEPHPDVAACAAEIIRGRGGRERI